MNRFDRPRQALAVSIACLAGFVDAVGFLSADRYFVSFMSGNTTRLAVDIVAAPRRAAVPALLLGGFVAGVSGGSVAARWAGPWRKPAVLALVAALLLLGAALHRAGSAAGSMAAMVLAMGAVNNSLQRGGEVAVGLTYMTGALVRLGQGIAAALTGDRRRGWGAHFLLWSGLLGGALLGAMAFARVGGTALWLAGIAAVLLATLASRLAATSSPSGFRRAPWASAGRSSRRPWRASSARRPPGRTRAAARRARHAPIPLELHERTLPPPGGWTYHRGP